MTESHTGSKSYAAVLVGAYSIDVIVGQAALSGYVDEMAISKIRGLITNAPYTKITYLSEKTKYTCGSLYK